MQNRITESFIKGTNNLIVLQLTENDADIIPAGWRNLEIRIGSAVVIVRTSNSAGVNLDETSGILTINPAQLIEDLTPLLVGRLYRVLIAIEDVGNPDNVVWGAADSGELIYFHIANPLG